MGNYSIKEGVGFRLKRVLTTIAIMSLIVAAFGVAIGHHWIASAGVEKTKEAEVLTARLMADVIDELIEKDILSDSINVANEDIKNSVKESNLKYQQRDKDAIRRYLMDVDKKWLEATDEHPLIKEYLDNDIARKLRSMTKVGEKLNRILITDRYGGLVASTGRIADFYQGDKDWWQSAFNNGKGAICVGNVIFDDRVQEWSIPFALPIKDETGEVIGVLRRLRSISVFFQPLQNFEMGHTGRSALVDDKGYLIFSQGVTPFSNKFCSYNELQKLLQSRDGTAMLGSVYGYSGKVIAASSHVQSPVLLKKEINWYVVVTEENREIFKSSNAFLFFMTIICIVLVIITLLAIKMIFSGALVKPIIDISEGVKHIGMGNLDYRLDINTGDIVESLASSINEMAGALKKTTIPVSELNKELTEYQVLEKKMGGLCHDFIAVASHVLGAILPLRQAIKTVVDDMPGQINEKHKNAINMIDKEIKILEYNMRNLIDMGRIETGKMDLNINLIEVKELLRKIVFAFESRAREKGLDFKADIPKGGKINIYADADRIFQVLTILMENAIKFTEKGYIEIQIKELAEEIEFCVINTGKGIVREEIQKIFDRSRHIGHISTENKGVGLGLAIAKGIIELHDGKIWVESEPGKMTKFVFTVPKDIMEQE